MIDLITDSYESSEITIQQKGQIYCKTLNDYDSKIFFSNGVKYYGSIENGILNGKGKMILPNGTIYTGLFKNNMIYGKGWLDYSDKEYYIGEIKNYQRNGQGEYHDLLKKIFYEGEWENDTFHGRGILRFNGQWEY